MNILNESGLKLPWYVSSDFENLLRMSPHTSWRKNITLRVGRTRQNRGPSGKFSHGRPFEVTVCILPRMKRADFRYVLAHELGHLVQYWTGEDARRETYAKQFAVNVCNCCPSSPYYKRPPK